MNQIRSLLSRSSSSRKGDRAGITHRVLSAMVRVRDGSLGAQKRQYSLVLEELGITHKQGEV